MSIALATSAAAIRPAACSSGSSTASSAAARAAISAQASSRLRSSGTGRSAADLRHRALGLDEPGLVDVVLELLAPDRLAHDACELLVARAVAQRPPEVGLVQREQARPQAAVGRQANAVAVRAERLRDGGDEADRALAVGEPVARGGAAGLAAERRERLRRVEQVAQLAVGQDAVRAPGAVGVERHKLDEGDLVGLAA